MYRTLYINENYIYTETNGTINLVVNLDEFYNNNYYSNANPLFKVVGIINSFPEDLYLIFIWLRILKQRFIDARKFPDIKDTIALIHEAIITENYPTIKLNSLGPRSRIGPYHFYANYEVNLSNLYKKWYEVKLSYISLYRPLH